MAKTIEAPEVILDLGDVEYVLKVTPRAAMRLNALHGGFLPLYERIRSFDLNTIADLIVHGAGLNARDRERVWSEVWGVDFATYLPALVEYLDLLMSGGRRQPTEDADEGPKGKR